MVLALGTRASLGWVLDVERVVARAHRVVARSWLHGSRVESAGFILLRFNRAVLDWSPVKQHVPGLLHGSIPAATARTTGPVCRAADSHNGRMFCSIFAWRFGIAVDARGATDWIGDPRLCLRHVSFRGATFRRAFTLSFTSR